MRLIIQLIGVSLILCAIVLPHEAGHYVTARVFGVGVQRFSLGFGPVLFSFQSGMTEWAVSAIPCGGYVALFEAAPDGVEFQGLPEGFWLSEQPPLHQFIIAIAGSIINFLMVLLIIPFLKYCRDKGKLSLEDVALRRERGSGFIGPIGILKIAGEASLRGPLASLAFIARFSLGIGVLQLMPFPFFDGSHALAAALEAFDVSESDPTSCMLVFVLSVLSYALYRFAKRKLVIFRINFQDLSFLRELASFKDPERPAD